MSTWTHLTGSIRVDDTAEYVLQSLFKTCNWGDKSDKWDACNVPCGTEGSVQIQIIEDADKVAPHTRTILISGDLRHYEDYKDIADWWFNTIYNLNLVGAYYRNAVIEYYTECGYRVVLTDRLVASVTDETIGKATEDTNHLRKDLVGIAKKYLAKIQTYLDTSDEFFEYQCILEDICRSSKTQDEFMALVNSDWMANPEVLKHTLRDEDYCDVSKFVRAINAQGIQIDYNVFKEIKALCLGYLDVNTINADEE